MNSRSHCSAWCRSFQRITLSFYSLSLLALWVPAADLVNDHAITVHSRKEAHHKRQQLLEYLWGAEGFPKRLPDTILTNVTSPVSQLTNLKRVDELRVDMAPGLQGLAYHFVPQKPNFELVVVHHGHACTLDDDPSPKDVGYGLQRTIHALLRAGYGVLGVFMPHMRPGDCSGGHDRMFQLTTSGSPMKYFLEPTALGLNYLQNRSAADHFPKYRQFHMTGLSGGGWTTTIYAAVDPRISCSFPVAGTIPLYLRVGGSVGDQEQFEPSFYKLPAIWTCTFSALKGGAESKRKSLCAGTIAASVRRNMTRNYLAKVMKKRCAITKCVCARRSRR